MNSDFEILVNDLRKIGLCPADAVLIHSSYKSMGGLDGGIQTLIDAVLAVIGEKGTLIVPTLSYATVTPENPVFDYLNTPSCVGAISNYVLKMDGAVRSVHPTHSCAAIGYKKEYYTKDHFHDTTPVGKCSPFYKLREDNGKILILGCSTHSNTSMHGVEEFFGVPYVLTTPPITYEIILNGRNIKAEHKRHSIKQNGYSQKYGRIIDAMDGDTVKHGTVHGADSYLINAPAMWDKAIRLLSGDPYYFVDPC